MLKFESSGEPGGLKVKQKGVLIQIQEKEMQLSSTFYLGWWCANKKLSHLQQRYQIWYIPRLENQKIMKYNLTKHEPLDLEK